MKMRILVVVEPGLDGVFRHVESLCRFLVRRDIECDLAYSSKRACNDLFKLVDFLNRNGSHTIDLNISNNPSFEDISAAFRLGRLIKLRKPDIIHAHSSKAGALVRVVIPFCFPSIPIVYTPHAYYGMSGQSGIKNRIFNLIERILSGIGSTINISLDERKFSKEVLGAPTMKSKIIPHGVDIERFRPVSNEIKSQLRNEYSIPADKKVVGVMGRFCQQKDYHTLYRALRILVERQVDFSLLEVSWNDPEGTLPKMAHELDFEERIIRVDYLDKPWKFYQMVDAIVIPSIYEAGIPYVALEAVCCGLPLIISNGIGLRSLASVGLSNIHVAQQKDPLSFAEAIEKIYSDDGFIWETNHRSIGLKRFGSTRYLNQIQEYLFREKEDFRLLH
jgi:glycosyltransferase involved in cell wall biosynthesis